MLPQGMALTRKGIHFCTSIVFFLDTFMVEDAVEAIGFGKFQWKLSVITGLAWASNCYQCQFHDHQRISVISNNIAIVCQQKVSKQLIVQ